MPAAGKFFQEFEILEILNSIANLNKTERRQKRMVRRRMEEKPVSIPRITEISHLILCPVPIQRNRNRVRAAVFIADAIPLFMIVRQS